MTGRLRLTAALWVLALAAAAAGAVLRFVTASPLWLDEALSVNIASLPAGGIVDALRHDGHPALYYLLLSGWLDVFGGSDLAARALSGVCSLGAVPLVYAAARLRFGVAAGRHAAVLALASPFLIRYGTEARMYALVVLLAAAGWLLTELALRRPTLPRLAALAAVVAAALHTHYWAIWLSAAACVALAAAWRRDPQRAPVLARVGAAYVAGGLAFAPWLGVLAAQAAHTGTPWSKWARPAEVAVETVEALGGGNRFEPVLLGVLLAAAALVGATLLRTRADTVELGWPGRSPSGALVLVAALTLLLGGAAALVTGGAFEARYAAVVVPLLLGLAGRGLAGLPRWLAPASLAAVAVFGVVVSVDEARRDRTQGAQVAAAVNANAAPGDAVVACPDQLAPSVLRYLNTGVAVLTFPPTAEPSRVDWYDYRQRIESASPQAAAAQADAAAGAAGSVWMVTAAGYRGFETVCDSVASELRAQGRRGTTIVTPREAVYEHMRLTRFSPAEP